MLTYIELEERKIDQRNARVKELTDEYEGAQMEYEEF